MFHMLTACTLKPGVEMAAFRAAAEAFAAHMVARGLMAGQTPVATRVRHPVLDTDPGAMEVWFTSSFRDRAQADRAVAEIEAGASQTARLHAAVFGRTAASVFTCFEDDQAGRP